ncbi:MAG: hypothetical protein LBS56_07380 [Propionibacteriaceae bacterium]|jgi:hypothetical protein|nr:hypothetical protein [Propionibacteriaceae bacterium]
MRKTRRKALVGLVAASLLSVGLVATPASATVGNSAWWPSSGTLKFGTGAWVNSPTINNTVAGYNFYDWIRFKNAHAVQHRWVSSSGSYGATITEPSIVINGGLVGTGFVSTASIRTQARNTSNVDNPVFKGSLYFGNAASSSMIPSSP